MPRSGPRPGQLLGAHPAVRALQPADLIDQPQPASAQVQVSPAAPPPVIDRRGQHPARAAAAAGRCGRRVTSTSRSPMTTSVTDAPGICSRRLNAVLTRTRCLRVAVGVVTPKPRATPRARPSFHPRNADTLSAQPKSTLTSTKAPTKTRGAPHMFELELPRGARGCWTTRS